MAENFADTSGADILSEIGEGGCQNPKHVPVFINGVPSGCASISHFDDYYNPGFGGGGPTINIPSFESVWGELPEGADGWKIGDLNKDGVREVYAYTLSDTGVETPHTVYGTDADGNVVTTPYDEWNAPDLTELIEQYGEDVVNTAKGLYDDLKDFIEGATEDPLGAIRSILDTIVDSGIPKKCQDLKDCSVADPDKGTYCWKDCVNFNVLAGIPGLPSLPGMGELDVGTYRDFEDAIKNVGKTIGDVLEGNNRCGEDTNKDGVGDEECTVGQVIKDVGVWVLEKLEEVLKGIEDATLDDAYDWIKGILGVVIGGYVFTQIEEEIKDIFFPISPDSDPFDETQCIEQKYFEQNKDACEAAGYVNCAGGENSQAQETTGGIIKGTLDDCDVIQDPQCIGDGRWDGEKCVCPDGTDKAGEEEPLDGDCSDEEDPTVDCSLEENKDLPECQEETEAQPCDDPEAVRRGGLSDGECVLPGRSCFSEPSKYSGDDANIDQGQFNSEGFCVAAGGDNGPDDTGGQCPADSERAGQNPVFDPRDTNQSGFFTAYTGITYQYDACNPSLGYTMVGQNVNVCEDKNNQNYGNIVEQPEEPCGECNPNFHKEGNKCVPDGDNGSDDGEYVECPNGGSSAGHIDNDCSKPCLRGFYDFKDGRGCISLEDICVNPQTPEEYRVCQQEQPTPEPNEGDDCPLGDNPTGGVLQEN
ncbi:MAG: hypothetical protein VW270_22125, partial [Candidatus Poseidoniales archaeon]